jgi:LAGLIDADG endonuclease
MVVKNRGLNIKKFVNSKGTIRVNQDTARFTISGIQDLVQVLIPHFDHYPLKG